MLATLLIATALADDVEADFAEFETEMRVLLDEQDRNLKRARSSAVTAAAAARPAEAAYWWRDATTATREAYAVTVALDERLGRLEARLAAEPEWLYPDLRADLAAVRALVDDTLALGVEEVLRMELEAARSDPSHLVAARAFLDEHPLRDLSAARVMAYAAAHGQEAFELEVATRCARACADPDVRARADDAFARAAWRRRQDALEIAALRQRLHRADTAADVYDAVAQLEPRMGAAVDPEAAWPGYTPGALDREVVDAWLETGSVIARYPLMHWAGRLSGTARAPSERAMAERTVRRFERWPTLAVAAGVARGGPALSLAYGWTAGPQLSLEGGPWGGDVALGWSVYDRGPDRGVRPLLATELRAGYDDGWRAGGALRLGLEAQLAESGLSARLDGSLGLLLGGDDLADARIRAAVVVPVAWW